MAALRRLVFLIFALCATVGLLFGLNAAAPTPALQVVVTRLRSIGESAVQAAHVGIDAALPIVQKKISDFHIYMVRFWSQQYLVLTEYCNMFAEMSRRGQLYASGLNAVRDLGARAYQGLDRWKAWLQSEKPAELARQLYAGLQAAVHEKAPALIALWRSATYSELGFLACAALLCICLAGAVLRGLRALCCGRHRAHSQQAATEADRQAKILMAPTPLAGFRNGRDSHPPMPQRRNRTDSPAPTFQKGLAKDENVSPNAEHALLAEINSAGADELKSIAGLGEKSAVKIVNYRRGAGACELETVQDLTKKVGLPQVVVAKLARQHGF
jgi:hypothetical protein